MSDTLPPNDDHDDDAQNPAADTRPSWRDRFAWFRSGAAPSLKEVRRTLVDRVEADLNTYCGHPFPFTRLTLHVFAPDPMTAQRYQAASAKLDVHVRTRLINAGHTINPALAIDFRLHATLPEDTSTLPLSNNSPIYLEGHTAPSTHICTLTIVRGRAEQETYRLTSTDAPFRIGRFDPDTPRRNHIAFLDPHTSDLSDEEKSIHTRISRSHGMLDFQDGTWGWINKRGSTRLMRPSFDRNIHLTGKRPHPLQDRDELLLGDGTPCACLRFSLEPDA